MMVFISGGFCCKPNNCPYSSSLKNAKDLNSNIPDVKWEVYQYYFSDVEDYFALLSEQDDTSYYLRMFKSNLPDSILHRKFYLLFEKEYTKTDTTYKLIMDTDTLCYFKYPVYDSSQKYFIVGKYYYLFSDPCEMERFTICQHSFFQVHLDSLVKIKGNELPELPCDSTYLE